MFNLLELRALGLCVNFPAPQMNFVTAVSPTLLEEIYYCNPGLRAILSFNYGL